MDTTEQLHFHFSFSCIEEGNGNPLQCSCLENPRDGGAWWASVYRVAQSWTRLKQLSSSSNPQELDIQLNITSSERTSLDHFILIPPAVFLPPPISLLSVFFHITSHNLLVHTHFFTEKCRLQSGATWAKVQLLTPLDTSS